MRNTSWTLSNFCRGRPPPKFELIMRAIPTLAKTIMIANDKEVLTDVCWAMSYISDNGPEKIPIIMNTNIVPRIIQLLEHEHLPIAVACLRTLGNLLTGSHEETQYSINAGALEVLHRLL